MKLVFSSNADENYKQEDIKNALKEITFELIEEIAY